MQFEKMNPEVRDLWADALESGEFAQTRNALHNRGGYCCLGVLCELHRRSVGGEDWVRTGREYAPTYLGKSTSLPDAVLEWAGLKNADPIIDVHPIIECTSIRAITANDDLRWDFNQIALAVRTNL